MGDKRLERFVTDGRGGDDEIVVLAQHVGELLDAPAVALHYRRPDRREQLRVIPVILHPFAELVKVLRCTAVFGARECLARGAQRARVVSKSSSSPAHSASRARA